MLCHVVATVPNLVYRLSFQIHDFSLLDMLYPLAMVGVCDAQDTVLQAVIIIIG